MGFKSDIEIAQETEMKVINEIADKIGIPDRYVENYEQRILPRRRCRHNRKLR